jgi:hypothetical protein
VYRLALPAWHRVMPFVVMAVMSIFGIAILAAVLWGGDPGPHLVFFVFWWIALFWNWYVLLGIPYEIRFDTSDRISFIATVRSTTMSATDIRSIKLSRVGGFYILRHAGGKLRLISQFTGFHEVISRIKAVNPSVEVVGI